MEKNLHEAAAILERVLPAYSLWDEARRWLDAYRAKMGRKAVRSAAGFYFWHFVSPLNDDPVYRRLDDGKFYFFDETWASGQGPFDSEFQCRKALDQYVREVLG